MEQSIPEVVSWSAPQMGGVVRVAISTTLDRRAGAELGSRRAVQRIGAWAARLTRFEEASDLSRLNASRAARVAVRPTISAALRWAETAQRRSGGLVNPTMLDERLAAERGVGTDDAPPAERAWAIAAGARGSTVWREPGIRFDLDGLAKGWLADRAAELLAGWPGAAVDADGDIALRADPGVEWLVDIADPRSGVSGTDAAEPLATLRFRGGDGWSQTYGVATSGTSVHRWRQATGSEAHHLIDPRTRRPAETDIVQATVVAPTAREAEVIAKSAVILGSAQALGHLDRSAALAAVLLLESGDVVCLPGIESWLA